MKILTIALAALFLVACKDDQGHDHGKNGHGHGHDHSAKHGGDMVELGAHEGFMEVKLSHEEKILTIWLTGESGPIKPEKPPVANIVVDKNPVQLTAKSDGDKWVFAHESFSGEPEKIRFRIAMNGKTYTPTWTHRH